MLGKETRTHTKPRLTYKDALTPEQAEAMESFLRALSWAGKQAIGKGIHPDVSAFINAYSGRGGKAYEEQIEERKWRARERTKKRRSG